MIDGHQPILPVLVFFSAALLMPLTRFLGRQAPWATAILACLAALILSSLGCHHALTVGSIRYAMGGWAPPIGIEFVLDPLSAFMTLVLSSVALVVLIHSREPVLGDLPGRGLPFYASAMLLLGGLAGIVLTGDLFNLFVFLEISSLTGYALLGAGSPRAAVSTFRYLMLGTVGASFYLIGLGFLLVETGSLNMADVAGILAVTGLQRLSTVALGFMLVGVAIKMALVPLHQWLPDAYSTATTTATALIAPIGTKVAAYVLIRLLYDVFPAGQVLTHILTLDVLAFFGAVGIVWGSVMAIPQRDMKRMLAYSSVAQIGYIALGIGLGTAYGLIGAILHILNHACMKACLFLATANLERRGVGTDISSLDASLRRTMPVTSASFTLAALSMIGLPPTAGFFSKWYLLLGSWQENRWAFIAVIILSSLLNAVYFFRIIERMYLREDAARPRSSADTGPGENHAEKATGLGRPVQVGRAAAALLAAPVLALALSLLALGLMNALIVTHLIRPMLP
jgi:multicomponent Na+:H+ antiporter subunit D